MDEKEFRVLIKHYFMKGKTPQETKKKLDKHYGDSAPSIRTVYKWIHNFRSGRMDTTDAERSGRPVEVTTPEIIDKIRDMVMDDGRVKVREIASAVIISNERVHHILHQHLEMTKLCARWVPRLLTLEQKRNRVKCCEDGLQLFQKNPQDFNRRFVTVDETWIHHYTHETKQQAESAPKKAKTVPSAGKIMATVFWDSQGIILIDYLEKDKTIAGAYYSSLLDRLKTELQEKRPQLSHKEVLFNHNNASAHISSVVVAKLREIGFQLVSHPPHSPDLAPSDYYLFPNLKKWLGGKRFYSNEEVIAETNGYFSDLGKSYYSEGISKLEQRWTKCISLKGDYVEK
uniref:Histonelysine Nmethyltransferase SETMARlike [Hydra vulgaris] n=1 Tax=Lepeophtheirus salmonis TaxID=72036 RepID=A0A0K2SWW6_LEPSM